MVRENLRYDYVYNWTTGPPCLEQAKKSNVAGPRSLAEGVQTQTECVILVYYQNARIIDTVKRMLLNLQWLTLFISCRTTAQAPLWHSPAALNSEAASTVWKRARHLFSLGCLKNLSTQSFVPLHCWIPSYSQPKVRNQLHWQTASYKPSISYRRQSIAMSKAVGIDLGITYSWVFPLTMACWSWRYFSNCLQLCCCLAKWSCRNCC